MDRILYLMNVDWNWIKQRPQFMAEELSNFFEIDCVTPRWYNRKGLQNRKEQDKRIHFMRFYGVPFAGRSLTIKKINARLRTLFVHICYLLRRPDFIYITYPDQYSNWMSRSKTRVIYDCMDNLPALAGSDDAKRLVQQQEEKLIANADYIFTTSLNLRDTLIKRYNLQNKNVAICRNGYSGKILDYKPYHHETDDNLYHFAYIGTISSWMNFGVLLQCVSNIENVVFHLIGPVQSGVDCPSHPRIVFEGTVEHEHLGVAVSRYDGLIMPFVVNDIIEAVDPVKLYEYINFCKPIISVRYPEIQRFEPFVFFYSSSDEFVDAVEQVMHKEGLKYSMDERSNFLADNTWYGRAEIVSKAVRE